MTIQSTNGALRTFYTHIDAASGLVPGVTKVRRGDVIGWVTHWKDSPTGTHLHFGAASRRSDGSYKGIDPVPLLDKTRGSTAAHDVTFDDRGGYDVGNRQDGTSLPVAPMKPADPATVNQRPNDIDCVRHGSLPNAY